MFSIWFLPFVLQLLRNRASRGKFVNTVWEHRSLLQLAASV